MPRVSSQASSLGTTSAAVSTAGFEISPTVLMVGMQQELPVPFRAQDRAFHDGCFESQLPRRILNTAAGALLQLRFAHDSTLPHLPFSNFELGLDKYNHFA